MTPQRIQRKRTRGWRMPEGAVYVGRPSRWGNPYIVQEQRSKWAVLIDGEYFIWSWGSKCMAAKYATHYYRAYAELQLDLDPHWLDPLRQAHYLACWCALDAPCHADVLIELLKEQETNA